MSKYHSFKQIKFFILKYFSTFKQRFSNFSFLAKFSSKNPHAKLDTFSRRNDSLIFLQTEVVRCESVKKQLLFHFSVD